MKAYLEVTVAGRHSVCLLDSGCELSMLPRRYVQNADLNPTNIKMYAANGTNIPVMGSVRISFTASGIPVSTTFLVSEAVDEPMLGLDWLTENKCIWKYGEGILCIGEASIQLQARPRRAAGRRVYVAEEITIPAGMVEDIPVALAWTSYEKGVNDTEWVLEPNQVAPGMVLARSILPALEVATGVSVINLSGAPCKLNTNTCLGVAVPVEIISPRAMNKTSSPVLKVDGSTRHGDGAYSPSGGSRRPSDGAPYQNNGLSSPIDGSNRLRDGETGPSGGARHQSDGTAGYCYGSSAEQTNFNAASNHSNEHLSPLLHDLKARLSDTEF